MRVLCYVIAYLPLPLLHGVGNLLGWLLWLIPNTRRSVAYINVEHCLPQLGAAERRRLVRRSLCHEMKSVLEMFLLWLGPASKVLSLIKGSRGEDVLQAELAKGKGLLLLTLHQGSWEAPALPYSKKYPITGLYTPQEGLMDELAMQGRTRFGAKMLAAEGGVGQKLVSILNAGETVYFMPDQDPPRGRGVYAPFFGIDAHSPTLVSKLVKTTGARVVFFYGERLPWGRGFIEHFHAAPEALYDTDLEKSVAGLNAGLELCARECIEQYWWGYKRFRRRREGEPKFYPGL